MAPSQIALLQRLGLAVLETVEEAGDLGAPSGVLYAAVQSQGASMGQYESFMGTLTSTSMLTLDFSHCYHITDKGREFMQMLRAKFPTAPKGTAATQGATA